MSAFEQLFRVMTKPWAIISYLGVVVMSFLFVDKSLMLYLASFDFGARCPWLHGLTLLGESKIYLIALLCLALLFRYGCRRQVWEERAWFLWLCVLVSNVICLVLKVFLGRARPELWFQEQAFGFYGFQHHASYWSFPSGHTTTVMSVVFGLSIVFPRYRWFYAILGCCVIASRLLLLQHYLSDVMIAAYLALIEVGVLWVVLRRKTQLAQALVV